MQPGSARRKLSLALAALAIAVVAAGVVSVITRDRAAPELRGLAFSADQDGDADIYVVDRDGSRLRKLTRNDVDDDSVRPSPDGRWIAFTRHRLGENVDFTDQWVMRSDGGDARRLRVAAGEPGAWSPDSDELLYEDYEREQGVLVEVASGRTTPVGPQPCCTASAWSPDGRFIAASVTQYGSANGMILIDREALSWRWLYHGGVGFTTPAWSPDGRRLAFTLSSDDTPPDARPLAVVEIATGRLTRLGPVGPEGGGYDTIAWAPGDRLAFTRLVGAGPPALFTWDGATTRRLQIDGPVRNPRPAPGGELAFEWGRFDQDWDDRDVAIYAAGRPRRVTAEGMAGSISLGGWVRSPGGPPPDRPRVARAVPSRVLTVERVGAMEARGDRIAVASSCGRIVVWSITSGASARTRPCVDADVTKVALGDSVATWVLSWYDREGSQDCILRAAVGSRIAPRGAKRCYVGPKSVYVTEGNAIEALAADARRVAFSESGCDPDDLGGCKPVRTHRGVFVVDGATVRLLIPHVRMLALVPGGYVIEDRGRTMIVQAGLASRIPLPLDSPRAAVAAGDAVAAFDRSGLLRVASASDGALLRSIRLRARGADEPRLEALSPDHAAVIVDGRLLLVRLRDGRAIELGLGPAAAPVHARLTGETLVVSFNRPGRKPYGRVVALPLRSLSSAFGR